VAQSIQLNVAGLYTAPSDLAGLPPGALDAAVNVESRHRNILESRRGFEALLGTELIGAHWERIFNFPILGVDRIVGLTSGGDLYYYNETTDAIVALTGYSSGLVNPDALAKSRFIRGGQNLYITDQSGVLSLSSGSGSAVLSAGVPRGLNLEASTTGSSGFLSNNVAVSTTGTVTSGSPTITAIDDSTGVEVGQYVSGTNIPAGTTVLSIALEAEKLITTATLVIGTATFAPASTSGLAVGDIVTGDGIVDGVTITNVAAPNITISTAPIKAGAGVVLTFSSPVSITMSANASSTSTGALSFYVGAQVAYRALFGRVETDINGNTTTRYGAPSESVVVTNTASASRDCSVIVTIPKNSDDLITFVQLYRSAQTASADIEPLDQMNLVYEANLTAGDFTARTVTITDSTPDANVGIPLYTGTDREGALQANLPPPACWDMTIYRDFALYANATQPSTLEVTLTSVGAPSGLQIGDVITITSGATSRTYTAAAAEVEASREFKVFSTGTPSQNITDTANSLIRVINYDEALPVHVILTSTTTDLPGQMTFESDSPYGTFTVTVNAHATAFDPTLTNLESDTNNYPNGVYVSKSSELESVPGANLVLVGDSSSPIYRVIALRDYVIVLKGDGIYKILGNSPTNLSASLFDPTTKVIGPDTACQLNSGVWMLSNQGVVSIDDAGVNAKSPPIDNLLNELIGSALDGLNEVAFAVGYESDRKYILSVPATSDDTFTSTQYVYNYVTDSWTTWDRDLYCGFIHSNEGKLYIGRADGEDNGLSSERKTGTYRDYSDEDVATTVSSVTSTTVIVLASVDSLTTGDILYQAAGVLSPVSEIDLETNTVTTQYAADWTTGAITIIKAIDCTVTFKQVFGDNPAFVRQFSEGLALFKATGFNSAELSFATDFSQSNALVDLEGTLLTGWGLFTWGSGQWGGVSAPSSIRFLVPQDKQLGSYIIPTLSIAQAWSNWKFQGLSMSWSPVSMEVGR
jgi:hypothetical protein